MEEQKHYQVSNAFMNSGETVAWQQNFPPAMATAATGLTVEDINTITAFTTNFKVETEAEQRIEKAKKNLTEQFLDIIDSFSDELTGEEVLDCLKAGIKSAHNHSKKEYKKFKYLFEELE